MISGNDVYQVLSALVPIYVSMSLAYASVRWFKIFSPAQCAGINSFVAVFCVPFLSFHFIAANNLYSMAFQFLAADCLQKLAVLAVLLLVHAVWPSSPVTIEWVISLFSITTLPNTLIIGIPLLTAMYGDHSASLMVQIVVLQSVIWYTVLIFLFEYRGAMIFIRQQFPDTADQIASIRVDSDVISMSCRDDLEADTGVSQDGKVHVKVRRSSVSSSSFRMMPSFNQNSYTYNLTTPRASNLTGVDIYSVQSTPRGSSFSSLPGDFQGGFSGKAGPSPRNSNLEDDLMMMKFNNGRKKTNLFRSVSTNSTYQPRVFGRELLGGAAVGISKDLHMFGWSPSKLSVVSKSASSGDPVSRITLLPETVASKGSADLAGRMSHAREVNGDLKEVTVLENGIKETESDIDGEEVEGQNGNKKSSMPPLHVLVRLILLMVWRKIIRNPNTYGCVLGLIWSLISFRFDVKLPLIVDKSVHIISDTGLGMAVFSLGLFMALQPKLVVCGRKMAIMSLLVRFLVGPIVIGVTSVAVGLRGDLLRISIIQATLPQGIVPFVFAKEYNVHADILSTAVIFGLILALPVTIVYYIILGLV